MTTERKKWSQWTFTVKTLPAPVYATVTMMKWDHGLSHWQTVILALLGLEHLRISDPEKVREAVAWVIEKYPDGKDIPTGKPWSHE